MARPPGIPNKPKEKSTKGAAPVTVAIQLKAEIVELNSQVERLGAALYEAHEMLLSAARKAGDADMAYAAGELKGYLKNNGLFDRYIEIDKQRLINVLEKDLETKPKTPAPSQFADQEKEEEEGSERVTSLLGAAPRR